MNVSKSAASTVDTLSTESNLIELELVLDTSIIHQFSLDPDFQYQKKLLKKSIFSEIWWDIKMALIRLIEKIFNSIFGIEVGETSSQIIFWILIAIVIILIPIFLWKFKKQLLTDSGIVISQNLEINQGDVNYLDEYNNSYQNQDYRGAIRYLLLHTLKNLNDRNQILFVSSKTLYEYQNEIKSAEIKDSFSEICNVYEYIFFGNFNATKSLCDLVYSNMVRILNLKSTV